MSARLMGWVPGAGRVDASVGTLARVGAMPDNDVVVRVEGVSRTHARVVGEQDGYWVEDANSRNGTWLNGERIKRARLRHLDIITLGRFADLVFVEREGGEPPPQVTSDARVRLEWLDGDLRGGVIDIPFGETLIGRAESCAVVINTPAISRAHARISNTGGRVVIEDLGSANGTMVNGTLINTPVVLAPGTEVVLGEARRFRVLIDGLVSPSNAPTDIGATPKRSQDMEWATRLVFSAEDLEAISRAAGGIDKPSPPAMRPVGKAATAPVVPVPPPPAVQPPAVQAPPAPKSAPAAAPAAEPAASAETVMTQEAGILRDDGGLRVPPGVGVPESPPTAPEAGETQYGGPGPVPPPSFVPPKFSPPAAGSTIGGLPPLDRTMIDRAAAPSAGNNLPPSVRPPARDAQMRIASVQLTGEAGAFTLAPGTATVGRSPEAVVRIESRELSRIHAIITISGRDVMIEDRGSVNGTSVNGAKVVAPTRLTTGDRVAFADIEFQVNLNWTEGN